MAVMLTSVQVAGKKAGQVVVGKVTQSATKKIPQLVAGGLKLAAVIALVDTIVIGIVCMTHHSSTLLLK